jgi:HAD superfamily hydrolase (TIGR01509 family)
VPCLPLRPRPGSPDAIVFDFDGVLVNTEPLHLTATQHALALRGQSIAQGEYYERYVGFNDVEMFVQMARDRGLTWCSGDVQELIAAKALQFEKLEGTAAILAPGAADCVRRLADLSPLGVASGARREEIERILARLELARYFRAIVASGETPWGKPAPDPYLAAAALLKAKPARTVAIEDTAAGLASARAAGLRSIGIAGTFPPSKLSLADIVVSSLDEITPEMLRHLLAYNRGGDRTAD